MGFFDIFRGSRSFFNEGVKLGETGRYKEAIECFDKVLDFDPENASAWYNKGVNLQNLGRRQDSIKCYDKALEIDPKIAAAWVTKEFY